MCGSCTNYPTSPHLNEQNIHQACSTVHGSHGKNDRCHDGDCKKDTKGHSLDEDHHTSDSLLPTRKKGVTHCLKSHPSPPRAYISVGLLLTNPLEAIPNTTSWQILSEHMGSFYQGLRCWMWIKVMTFESRKRFIVAVKAALYSMTKSNQSIKSNQPIRC